MSSSSRVLLAILVALTLLAPLSSAQEGGEVPKLVIMGKGRVEGNFAAFRIVPTSGKGYVKLRFNITGYEDKLTLAYAKLEEGGYVIGKVEGNYLVFDFGRVVNKSEIVVVFRDVLTFGEEIRALVPLPFSPVGWRTSVYVRIRFPTVNVNVVYPRVSKEAGDVIVNMTFNPGELLVLNATMDPYDVKLAKVSRINRTVIIEEEGKAEVRDTVEIVGLSDMKLDYMSFYYPPVVDVIGVEGPLGPYPEEGFVSYKVFRSPLHIEVRVRLRAPPSSPGEKAFLTIRLLLPLNETEEGYSLPLFFGNGYPVSNVAVLVKVRGEASFKGVEYKALGREDGYSLYAIKVPGTIFEENIYGSATARLKLVKRQGVPFPLIAAVGVLAAITAAVAVVSRRASKEGAKVEEVSAEEVSPLYEALRDRARVLEAVLETLDMLDSGRISRQTYRQRIAMLKRHERSILGRVRRIAPSIGEEPAKLVEEIDSLASEFWKMYDSLSSLERRFRRGLISKREYKSRRSEVVKKMSASVNRMYELIEKLRGF